MEEIRRQLTIMSTEFEHMKTHSADLEARMRKVEMAVYKASGGLAILLIILKFIPTTLH